MKTVKGAPLDELRKPTMAAVGMLVGWEVDTGWRIGVVASIDRDGFVNRAVCDGVMGAPVKLARDCRRRVAAAELFTAAPHLIATQVRGLPMASEVDMYRAVQPFVVDQARVLEVIRSVEQREAAGV